ncbi:MAG: adenylate/guanylate cyclase domain-containing protein [bacterium]
MKDKKLKIIGILIGIAVSGIMLVTFMLGMWTNLENKALDLRFLWRGKIPTFETTEDGEEKERVVVVGIDEASIEQYGRFPWPRDYHARLVDVLTQAGAKAIVFDIILSEPDNVNPAGDWKLAMATSASKRVIHCSFFEPRKVAIAGKGLETLVLYHEPIEQLKDSSWKTGFTNAYPDSDGVLRHCSLEIRYNDTTYYPINLLAASLYTGKKPEDILSSIPEMATYKAIDLDAGMYRKMLMVNFYGPEDSFPSYSYHQLLNEAIPLSFKKNWVEGKVVLIGSKIVGAFDHYPVPFAKMYPGVEFHATIINNLIEGNFITRIPPIFVLILIVLGGVFCGVIIPRFSPLVGTTVMVSIVLAYVFGTQWLFQHKLIYMQLVPPLMTLVISYVSILFYRFFDEEKEKRRIKRSFGQYVSKTVLDEILSNPNLAKLGGERRNLTILFSDIRGFTALSEGMTPEQVVEILNEYLTKMTEMVYKHGGTLDKFIGDAVMAFWGAPTMREGHEERAVLCAIDMMDALLKLKEKWQAEGKLAIDIGIGINTGEAVVGNMGSQERMDYTVIGDNVNLASRLEGINKAYQSHIIISESTKQGITNGVDTFSLGGVKVPGKAKAIKIFQVLGRSNAEAATWRDKESSLAYNEGTREFKNK